MKRIRWFGADWQSSFKKIGAKMRAHPFREDSTDGFLVDRVRDGAIVGRYIEKNSFQEKIVDPFGDEHLTERTLYSQIEFHLFQTFPNIELWDAPRGTSGYISKLLEFSDFTISISPLAINPLRWAEAFQSIIKVRATVVELQISQLEIEAGVSARIVVAGSKDVREALKILTRNKQYELDRIHLAIFQGGTTVTIQLASTGIVKMEPAFLDSFLPALRGSLPRP